MNYRLPYLDGGCLARSKIPKLNIPIFGCTIIMTELVNITSSASFTQADTYPGL